jgi:hypothetical protein
VTEHVTLPHSEYLDKCIRILIPHYSRYIYEYKSNEGDHSKCASTFLFEVLPFVVETILQCGFYFIKEFPNHELSRLLELLPNYVAYAPIAIQSVDEIARNRTAKLVTTLNENVAQAVGSLQQEVQSLKTQVMTYQQILLENTNMSTGLCDSTRYSIDRLNGKVEQLIKTQQSTHDILKYSICCPKKWNLSKFMV